MLHPTDESVGARMGESLVLSYSRAAVLIFLRELLRMLCPLSLLLLIVAGGRVGSGVLLHRRAVAGKLGDGTRYHVRDLALCIPHKRIAVHRANQLFWYGTKGIGMHVPVTIVKCNQDIEKLL